MKAITIVIAIVSVLGLSTYVLHAQQDPDMQGGMKSADMNSIGMMGKGMGRGRMMGGMMQGCPMHMMMVNAMMKKELLATQDGGVIVLTGNTLSKYDKDLNLVKEVQIKVDVQQMQKNMQEMMKNCSMCKPMTGMQKGKPSDSNSME